MNDFDGFTCKYVFLLSVKCLKLRTLSVNLQKVQDIQKLVSAKISKKMISLEVL